MKFLTKKTLGIALLTTAMVAVGGGVWWMKKKADTQLPEGVVATTQTNLPFNVNSCTTRFHQNKPSLAILFSTGVDDSQSIDQLIEVVDLGKVNSNNQQQSSNKSAATETKPKVVKGGWIVDDNASVIIFPYVEAGHRYKINISEQLTSVNQKNLNQTHSCEIVSDEMSPSFFFASKGTVLPAGLNGGLPVVTVNVPEVDVEFIRVSPEKLPKFINIIIGKNNHSNEYGDEDGYYYGSSNGNKMKGSVSGWELNELKGIGESVYQNRFITNEEINTRKTSLLPVEKIKELQESGIYVAVMRRPGEFDYQYQVTYFYVSDIGLHARRQINQTDVFTTSLVSGKEISGAELEILDGDGKVVLKGKTNSDGHGVLGGLPDSARLLMAKRGKEISVIALQEPGLDLSEFDINGHLPRDTKLFVWSGRDLYRPGEKFIASMNIRSAQGTAIAPRPIKVTTKKPGGEVVNTMMWQPNPKTPGYMQNAIQLPADAATGMWSLEFRVDPTSKHSDAIFQFQVEEFLPERMKLTLTSDESALFEDGAFNVSVQGDYLYGAPAAGNRLLGTAFQSRISFPHQKTWPGFYFGDDNDNNRKASTELTETSLNDKGAAEISVPFEPVVNSAVEIRATMSLLESGGRPVVRTIKKVLWPAKAMLGLRPVFENNVAREGSLAEFELIRVDTAGKFEAIKTVDFRLVKEDRSYYWRFDQGRGWHSGFTESEEIVQTGAVDVSKRVKFAVPVNWGKYRIELLDSITGKTMVYRFYAGWNAQDSESMGNRPDRVKLQLEGAPVKPGNDVKLNIIPPHDGEALVIVEADKVLWSKRISVTTSGTKISIPIDKNWNRSDMYISTVVFRPGSQGDRVTPARAVGMTWLALDRDARKLNVKLNTPSQIEPDKRLISKVKVDGANGKTVMVTVSAVDVGILNITNFKTPSPFDFFFGKHRFGAELSDIYGKLIERMDGEVGKIKWGGDAAKRDSTSMPKKVKLVDLFSGPVLLNAKGEADVPLNIPDFNGTLRVMVVASTEENFGSTEKEVVVSAPIVAEIALPRFIGLGDNSTIAVDVTNMMKNAQDISVKVNGDKLLKIADGDRQLKLTPKQRQILRFNIEPTEPFGIAKINLDLKTGGDKPVVIRREFALQIQPPVPREQDAKRVRIDAGATHQLDANMVERFYKNSSLISVTLSNKPPINVNSVVKGLLDYPYGCVEQTTSAAYPHVFIDEESAKAVGLTPRTRAQRAAFIAGAIGRITGMQGSEGGFRLWNGSQGNYEQWLTPYVNSFLMDAREAGFDVPEEVTKRSQKWMTEKLNGAANQFSPMPSAVKLNANSQTDWRDYELIRNSHQRFAELSHIGYMLAREQKANLASLRLLHDNYRERARSPLPLVHLGIALSLMGDQKRADVAINEAMGKTYGIRGTDWEWLGDYGSQLRDQSFSYALMFKHKITHPQRELLLDHVSKQLDKSRYFSTQERIALFLAARAAGGSSAESWAADMKTVNASEALSSKENLSKSLAPELLVKGVTIENKGKNPLWLEVEASGFPLKLPIPSTEKMKLERHWFTTDGKPWNGGTLKVGEMLLVRVTAKANQKINDGMIIDHIPAGLEVENLNLSQGPQANEFNIDGINLGQAMLDHRIKHKEYRDDRFVAAVELSNNPIHLFYMLRVVTPGRFHVPGTYAEDMYRPEIRAYGPSSAPVTVVDPRGSK